MTRQVGIELLRHLVQTGQAGPWHSGEVMVLVMQADVVRQQVQRAIV